MAENEGKAKYQYIIIGIALLALIVAMMSSGSLGKKPNDPAATEKNSNNKTSNVEFEDSHPQNYAVLEAEDAIYIEPPVSVVTGIEGASKDKCCYIGPEKINEKKEVKKYKKGFASAYHPGFAKLKFRCENTANYCIWARVMWSDDCGDSLDIAVNGKFLGTVQGNSAKYSPKWIWLRAGGAYPLSKRFEAGKDYTIELCNREDDLYFDQVLLLGADEKFQPSGILK
jgi:hypothetical protein